MGIANIINNSTTTSGGEIVRELVNSSDGAGLHFDGSGVVAATPVDLGSKFSHEFVISTSEDLTSGSSKYIIDYYGATSRFIIGAHPTNSNGNIAIFDRSSWVSFGVNPLTDRKVHHLVVTVDGTSAVLFDNGNQVATATINAGHNIDNATNVGLAGYYNNSNNFEGTIYRARSYNKTLTSAEVQTAYERADVDFADQYGSQATINSGTTTTGKRYRITARDGVDFTTIGAADNNVGTEFLATGSVTLDANDTVVKIGCVTDYDLAFANPTQSLTVQDRSGAADGTASASGVTQVQPVVQLNAERLLVNGTVPRVGIGLPVADSPGGLLSIDATNSNTPKILFENQAGETADAAITTIDDTGGTDICIGSNVYINSAGYLTRFNAAEESSYIYAAKTGNVYLGTGDTSATASNRLQITKSGDILINAPGFNANVGAKKMQFEGSASTAVGPEMLLHNPAQGGGAASLLTFGGKASGTEGYTAAIKATNTGTLTIGTSSASGGFSEPAADLTISSTGATTLTASSQNVLHVNRTTSDGDCLLVESGGSAKMRIGTLGITFPNGGYAPAAAAANQLDYYEEGTWTPVYAPSSGSFATMTMDVLSAKYTRVGNTVFVQATIRTDDVDITGGSGSLRINGLPFPVAGSGAYGTLYIGEAGSFASGKFPCAGYCTVSQSYITLTKLSGVAGSILGAQVDSLTTGTTANQNSLIFAARYTV